jgi:hypothetical protein
MPNNNDDYGAILEENAQIQPLSTMPIYSINTGHNSF